jgi:hypothetical protein
MMRTGQTFQAPKPALASLASTIRARVDPIEALRQD